MLAPCSLASRDTPVTAIRRQARKSVAAALMVLIMILPGTHAGPTDVVAQVSRAPLPSCSGADDSAPRRPGDTRAHLQSGPPWFTTPHFDGYAYALVRSATVHPVWSGIPHRGMLVAVDMSEQTAIVPGYAGHKDDHLKRLRRIEGQVRGIARMVESDAYCIDVLTQVSAVTRALQAVSIGLLEEHIEHCVVDAARESDEAAAAKVAEATAAIARLVRS